MCRRQLFCGRCKSQCQLGPAGLLCLLFPCLLIMAPEDKCPESSAYCEEHNRAALLARESLNA